MAGNTPRVNNPYPMAEGQLTLMPQIVRKKKTINDGIIDEIEITIPEDVTVKVTGVGFKWFSESDNYKLWAGQQIIHNGSNQIGSVGIPASFSPPFTARGSLRFRVANGSGTNNDYEVVWLLLVSKRLEEVGEGGELVINTETSTLGSNVTTLTGSKTSLENIETANNSALTDTAKGLIMGGRVKASPPAITDGDFVLLRVNTKGEIITSPLAGGMSAESVIKGSLSDTASSTTDVNLSATIGAGDIVKEVYLYFPSAGDDAEISVYDGDPAGAGVLIDTWYYNCSAFMVFLKDTALSTGLYLRVGGKSGSTQTAYYTVKYQS